MKKSLMVIVAFVLIFTHIIPPLNISFANEEVNECENMDFTVQTIVENDKKIIGTGLPSDQLTVEFRSKNKTEIVNVNSSGKFEYTVEKDFLELNDVVTIGNEYYKVETKVAIEGADSQAIQSSQYVECPEIVDEESESEAMPKEETSEPEESSEETVSEEETSEPEETSEEPISEEETSEPEETSEEPISEEETSEPEESPEEPISEEETSEPEESPEETVGENGTTEKTGENDVPKEKKKEEALEDIGRYNSIKKVESNSVDENEGVDKESINENKTTDKYTKFNKNEIEASPSEKNITENAKKKDEVEETLFKSHSNYNFFKLPELSISPYIGHIDVYTNRGISKNDVKEPLLGNVEIFHDYYVETKAPEPISIDGESYYNVEITYGGEGLVDVDLIGEERALVLYSPKLVGKLHQHPNNIATINSDLVGLDLTRVTALTGGLTQLTTGLVSDVTNLANELADDLNLLGLVKVGITGLDNLGTAVQNLNNIDIALNQLLKYEDQIQYQLIYDSNGQTVGVQVEFSQGLGNHLNGAIELLETTLNELIFAIDGIGISVTVLGLPIGDLLLTELVGTVTSTLLTPVTTLTNQLLGAVEDISTQIANVQVLGKTSVDLNLLVDNPANVPGDVADVYVAGIQDTSVIDLNLLSQGQGFGIIEFDEDTTVPILKLETVPNNIQFGNIEIKNEKSIFGRQSPDNVIEIKDTRKNDDWVLRAKAANLTAGNNVLENALIYIRNGEEVPINDTETTVAESTDENVVREKDNDTITWNNNAGSEDGLLLKVNPIEAVAGEEYSTKVEWTLTDGP